MLLLIQPAYTMTATSRVAASVMRRPWCILSGNAQSFGERRGFFATAVQEDFRPFDGCEIAEESVKGSGGVYDVAADFDDVEGG
jgi:hypothetical protein